MQAREPRAVVVGGLSRRQLLAIVLTALGVAVALVGAMWISSVRNAQPRLNAKIEDIVHFTDDGVRFRKLPFDRQSVYMKLLEQREKEVTAAFKSGKIKEEEYRTALDLAWFGKQITRMNRYSELKTPAERQKYLDKQIGASPKSNKSDGKKAGSSKAANADVEDSASQIKSDKVVHRVYPLSWPTEVRAKWDDYRRALKTREKERIKMSRPVKKPAAAVTPATPTTQKAK